jgi:rare lipoprotein A
LVSAVAVAAGVAVLCVAVALSIARMIPAPERGAGLTALPRTVHLPLVPNESPNRAKKAAREPVHMEARLTPQATPPQATQSQAELSHVTLPEVASPDATPPEALAPQGAPEGDDTIEENGSAQIGRASWYDLSTKTASGEKMDGDALTAAHRTLPLGTRVRVANLDNGRELVVRINDRGPFAKDRIIDLSKEAARQLGMVKDGVANVQVSPVAGEVASNAASGGATAPVTR